MARPIRHLNFILHRERLSLERVLPGMIIEFSYRGRGDLLAGTGGDKKPLFLVMGKEVKRRLLHGVNLNYLNERMIQRLFTLISKKYSVDYIPAGSGYKWIDGPYTQVAIPVGNRVIPTNIYEEIIKPKVIDVNPIDYDCYRTYNMDKISFVNVINYKLNIHMKNIKKELEKMNMEVPEELEKGASKNTIQELLQTEKGEKLVKKTNKANKK